MRKSVMQWLQVRDDTLDAFIHHLSLTKLANSYNYGVSISNGQVSKDCLHFL